MASTSDAAEALVGDLTAFSSEQISSGLENAEITFTCKVCCVKATTLRDLLEHLSKDGCSGKGQQSVRSSLRHMKCDSKNAGESNSPVHARGRPRKEKVKGRDADETITHKASMHHVMIGSGNTGAKPIPTSRRVTRISSGSLRRKTAAELLGHALKTEPSDEEIDPASSIGRRNILGVETAKRGRGRPPKVKAVTAESSTSSVNEKLGKQSKKLPVKELNRETQSSFVSNIVSKVLESGSEDSAEDVHGKSPKQDDGDPDYCSESRTTATHRDVSGITVNRNVENQDGGLKEVKRDLPDTQLMSAADNVKTVLQSVHQPGRSVTDRPWPPKIVFKEKPASIEPQATRVIKLTVRKREAGSDLPNIASEVVAVDPNVVRGTVPDLSSQITTPTTSNAVEEVSQATTETSDSDMGVAIVTACGKVVGKGKPSEVDPVEKMDTAEGSQVKVPVENTLPDETCSTQTAVLASEMSGYAADEQVQGLGAGEVDTSEVHATYEYLDNVTLNATELQELTEVENAELMTATQPAQAVEEIPDVLKRAKWKRYDCNFRCPHCKSRAFATKEEVDLHVKCHVDVKLGEKYECPLCHLQAPQWTRLLYHLLQHDVYREMLRGSEIMKNMLGEFKCPICSKVFEKKVNFTCHYHKVHFKKNRVCDICGGTVVASDIKTFKRHVERCKNITYKCSLCEYTTKLQDNLKSHMNVHSDNGYKCHICSRKCVNKARLKVHLNTHDPNRLLHMCDQCGRSFKTSDAVKKHVLRFHSEVRQIYKCDCGYSTHVMLDLKKHVHTVHNKKFQCNQCDFQTNTEHQYKQHQVYHMPERIYPCPYAADKCYYRGCNSKQVSDHMAQVHNVKSKHQCPLCFKFYKKRVHLLRHLVSHTGEKAYHCKTCGMEFVSHSTYYRHRAKTGHDAKREGIVSVPQNITIQYVEEAVEETVELSEDSILEQQHPSQQQGVPGPVWHMMEVDSAHVADDVKVETLHSEPSSEVEQVAATNVITQALHDMHHNTICTQDEGISVHPNISVTIEEIVDDQKPVPEALVPPSSSFDVDETVVTEYEAMELSEQDAQQMVEGGVDVVDSGGNTPQVIYVVKGDDGSMIASTDQVTSIPLDHPSSGTTTIPVSQDGVGSDSCQEMSLNQLMSHHQVVMQEDGSMAFVEVQEGQVGDIQGRTIKTEDGQYAVVIEEVNVPEAAISMLQLQAGQHD